MENFISHLNVLDYVLMGVVALSVIISFFRGLLREAISLVTWFLAFFIALKFSPDVSSLFHNMIHSDTVRHILAVLLLFFAVLIIGMILNKLAHTLVSVSGLGLFDRLLGFIFGTARGLLFVVIILLVIQASSYQKSDWMQQSQLAPCFRPYVAWFQTMMPNEMNRISMWLKTSVS